MEAFYYRDGQLLVEQLPLSQLAVQHGTPLYVYSRAALEQHWREFAHAFSDLPHLICYAVKANSNLAVLNLLARLGSGFDIVSGGELQRVLRAGGDAAKIVFSGVGKTHAEIELALSAGILCFNVESADELQRIGEVAAAHGVRAPVSLRVNPDVDAGSHPYISTGLRENKFGIDPDHAQVLYQQAAETEELNIVGMDCHIGSQLTDIAPFQAALERLLRLADRLADKGIHLHHLDLGGGLGVRYREEQPPTPQRYAQAISAMLKGRNYRLILEPGRAIAANAGVLLTKVEYLKHPPNEAGAKYFAIVDAAMNDLIRPALYGAWQEIVPVTVRYDTPAQRYEIVGPICETGDFLGKERSLALRQGDVLAIRSAGAYGFVMSSQYNSRPRAAEIVVDHDQAYIVRARENVEDLWHGEACLPGA